ncbi:MAG: hypothetical protein BA864_09605 [Desulfuromonadales bacterium C00003093]|nr:MAG: hypothetical protein BA864_09605 [Desulfuromonadales bacterium C00003093]
MAIETKNDSIDAILFDLDGTLLRVQMTEFIPQYIEGLAAYCRDWVKPRKFAKGMLKAIRELIQCDGDGMTTNEQRVFATLHQQLAVPEEALREAFSSYEQNGLESLRGLVKPIPLARKIIEECLAKNIPLVLATNPVFPEFMIRARLRWGGLADVGFQHLTSYENSCYCKPHAGYFSEVAEQLRVAPENCLMVGNDTSHDLSAAAVGMKTYLVDTWIVEREEAEWPCDNRGDHQALQCFLQQALV